MVTIKVISAAAILTIPIILAIIIVLATPFIMNFIEDYYDWADAWYEQRREERRGRRD